MRACAHVPEISTICATIKGRGAFETKGLICEIENLLLFISGRQAHRAFFPGGVLVHSLMDKKSIEYFHSATCKQYPNFDRTRIEAFNFSGLSSFTAYNRITQVSCPAVLRKFATQIFFHSVWGTYCENLGVLQWMVAEDGEWSDRSDMGNCFKGYGTCDSNMAFNPPKIRYFSKLCSASNSGLLGRREQQTVNS